MSREKLDIRIEVEDTDVLILLPRVMDDWMTPWQEAWNFGTILEKAAEDVPTQPLIINWPKVHAEQASIKIGSHNDKYVLLLFEHTDRIRLSPEAAKIVARGIRKKAQDLEYLTTKGVRFLYNKKGRTLAPMWLPRTRTVFGPKG